MNIGERLTVAEIEEYCVAFEGLCGGEEVSCVAASSSDHVNSVKSSSGSAWWDSAPPSMVS